MKKQKVFIPVELGHKTPYFVTCEMTPHFEPVIEREGHFLTEDEFKKLTAERDDFETQLIAAKIKIEKMKCLMDKEQLDKVFSEIEGYKSAMLQG